MKKRLLSIMLAMTVGLSLTACGEKPDNEPVNEVEEESTEDSYSYNISALLSDDNTYNEILLKGFNDCLEDYLGEEHFTLTTYTVSDELNSEAITSEAIKKSPDMIFTAGKPTLNSAAAATSSIPIVATDIVDFKGTLRIASLNGKSWDKTTGRNITGISSKPSIVDQVSLMVEATDDLQTVGILFSPEDTDSIYQNEIFEAYLDQAGIPWKEYLIPATDTAISESVEQNSTALTPSKFVAYSAKSGMDNIVSVIGEESLLGLNSPSSTRVALASEFWTGPKHVHKNLDDVDSEGDGLDVDSGEGAGASSDKSSGSSKNSGSSKGSTSGKGSSKSNNSEEDAEPTLEELIQQACDECSAIYVPFGSMLTDQMEIIGSIATESNVVVVAGDTQIGQNALVTLFYDPYALGYAAGKKAVRVFNGDDITTIKIGYGDADDSIKLYNGEIAAKFEKEFPKSFKEFKEFLETYEYGSNTVRYSIMGE